MDIKVKSVGNNTITVEHKDPASLLGKSLEGWTLEGENGIYKVAGACTVTAVYLSVGNPSILYTDTLTLVDAEADQYKTAVKDVAGTDDPERAQELRKTIEELALKAQTDQEALDTPELYPLWDKNSHTYKKGDRVRSEDILYKVLQPHTSQETWSPRDAPSLFAKILAGQDGTAVGEWQQPDSTNPYKKGDKVLFKGKKYVSLIDNNVWSPEAYAQGWKEEA